MNWKFDCAKTPKRLFCNSPLHYSAMQLGCALYAIQKSGSVTRSLSRLSRISGIGSVETVRKGLQELQDAGFIIAFEKHYRKHALLDRDVYDSFSYRLDMSFTEGYVLIPKSILRSCRGQYSTFAVAAYICIEMGNKERAFPSLKRIAKGLGGMAISTVCRAVKALVRASVFVVQHCQRRNQNGELTRHHACNSYFPLKSLSDRKYRGKQSSILFVTSASSLPSYIQLSLNMSPKATSFASRGYYQN